MLHHQGNIQLLAQGLAMRHETIGRGLQTMVHMHRPHLPWPALRTGQ
jgi:hypothetical protein